ncbi:hypothetical protein Cgig2_001183 [Carnegiea gigantea]|uniref:Reverse transcriptase zinc-binding domain-containing protein n=1 Tax=Carnegiea gigantea TaxID=171969 RepID=A0A9Q1QAS4_9CARY|nr:hypothetical protein Cgig2_001183 [Carnegiea gigantea]
MERQESVPWAKVVWARPNIPRHAFISWHRLPTKLRLAKPQQDTRHAFCNTEPEDETHHFYTYKYAEEVWRGLKGWWEYIPTAEDSQQMLRQVKKRKGGRIQKNITTATITATIYSIWQAGNSKIFTSQNISGMQTIQHIKDQVQNRILFINTSSRKYSKYIDKILG